MIEYATETATLDLNSTSSDESRFVWAVPRYAKGSIMAEVVGGSWGSGVVTLYRSNDATSGTAFALSSPTTITADGFTDVDTSKFHYLHARVTTAAGAAAKVRLTLYVNDLAV